MGTASQWSGEDPGVWLNRSVGLFDIYYFRLVPQFNERDSDTFFVLFQHVAESIETGLMPTMFSCYSVCSQVKHRRPVHP